jgi:hypothetical protein
MGSVAFQMRRHDQLTRGFSDRWICNEWWRGAVRFRKQFACTAYGPGFRVEDSDPGGLRTIRMYEQYDLPSMQLLQYVRTYVRTYAQNWSDDLSW